MTVSYEDRANDNPTHMKIDDKTKDKTIYRE